MKNKLIALLASIGMVSSVSAVEINENLSINGFIDASYSATDQDAGTAAGAVASDDAGVGIDEVELQFEVNFGAVSGSLHIDSQDVAGAAASDETVGDIEQVHVTYSLDNGVSFTVGRYGSALGLEREDPAGLYTFSRAYDDTFNLGDIDRDGGSVEGITVAYAADTYSVAASFEGANGANLETDDLNIEIAASYTGVENLSVGLGYFVDNGNDQDIVNIHAAYGLGKTTIAAEYTTIDNDAGENAFLLLADHDFTDQLGGAIRYSEWETGAATEAERFTIAPNYSITDNLGAIVEYSSTEDSVNGDSDLIAVELTYTF